MIAVDTNLLVYAHREDSPWHPKALESIRMLADGSMRWAIPWPCVHEYLAVVTHPRIYKPPTPFTIAVQSIQAWKASSMLSFIGEGETHLENLSEACLRANVQGAMVHDAKIAAICLDHGIKEFWSADRDFSRFPKLKLVNPLV